MKHLLVRGGRCLIAAVRRLWPRRLYGQLALTMLTGLVSSHLATLLVLGVPQDPLRSGISARVVEHLASAYQLARAAAPQDVERLLRTMDSSGTQFRVSPADQPPPPTPVEDREPALHALIASQLPEANRQLRVRLEWNEEAPLVSWHAPEVWVHAAARLPDGRWLIGMQRTQAGRPWWWWLALWMPVSALPVLVLLALVLHRAVRPVQALAAAAEKVSRGERIEPLPLRGPSEVRDVAAAFNTMQARQRSFLAQRMQMLAAISHDVRTPITSLRVRAALVDDPALREAMTRTLSHMQAMVEQTLAFARDDAHEEAVVDVDLREMVAALVHDAHSLGHDVQLEDGAALHCRCRITTLRRAVGNLLDNAVQHGGGTVRVRLARGPTRIEIDDEGPGLPEDLLETVFEPYFQLDTARSQDHHRGTGLGLAIARSCARAHGGEVVLARRPGGGLRATLTLP